MKRGAIKITHELLHELLSLDDKIHIDEVVIRYSDKFTRSFHIILSGDHKNMYEHLEGHEVCISPIEDFQKEEKCDHELSFVPSDCGGEGKYECRLCGMEFITYHTSD